MRTFSVKFPTSFAQREVPRAASWFIYCLTSVDINGAGHQYQAANRRRHETAIHDARLCLSLLLVRGSIPPCFTIPFPVHYFFFGVKSASGWECCSWACHQMGSKAMFCEKHNSVVVKRKKWVLPITSMACIIRFCIRSSPPLVTTNHTPLL